MAVRLINADRTCLVNPAVPLKPWERVALIERAIRLAVALGDDSDDGVATDAAEQRHTLIVTRQGEADFLAQVIDTNAAVVVCFTFARPRAVQPDIVEATALRWQSLPSVPISWSRTVSLSTRRTHQGVVASAIETLHATLASRAVGDEVLDDGTDVIVESSERYLVRVRTDPNAAPTVVVAAQPQRDSTDDPARAIVRWHIASLWTPLDAGDHASTWVGRLSNLSEPVVARLQRADIETIGDLMQLSPAMTQRLAKIGGESLVKLRRSLADLGIDWH